MILWLIGMSGAGKTVVGKKVVEEMRKQHNNVVFLDGDIFRTILGDDVGHTMEDRKKNADRICRMCEYLDSQGIHVVFAILSLFHESQEWNRANIKNYYEVYLKVSFDTLVERDSKGLYRKALQGEIDNVVGVDIDFPEPLAPDLIINNEGDIPVDEIAQTIIENITPLLEKE